jgi:hypothetical protein
MLFRPFRFKTWLKIGFIGWLAGAASGGGCNLQLPSGPGQGGGTSGADIERTIHVFLSEHLLVVILMVAFAIALSLAFFYLSCRFRFILFDSVLQRDPQIGRGWQRYGRPANRYFGFLLCYMFAFGLLLTLIVGLPLLRAYRSGVFKTDNPLPALLPYLIPMVLAVFLFVIVVALITSLLNDFVIPLLALDEITIAVAWSRLKQMIAFEPGAFAGYLGMKLVLAFAAAAAATVAMLVAIVVLAIPAVGVTLVLVALLKGAGPGGLVVGIIFAVLGIFVATGLLLLIVMLASAPVAVFLTSYSFYFFGGRYPRLGALLWPQPPAPVTPPPGVPPPPLPPIPGAAPAM